ncbi:hypothetical protein [Kitasatospora mediocidica]|uniref:hypothetical protein n=1 Tax=Kitasatospora mediocidica TaxID=58352 RepID=UPI00068D830E|nr:hypothetical protein [Kitasatospora mediocidica]
MATPVLVQQAVPVSAPSGDGATPGVAGALAGVLPEGGVRRGTVVSVAEDAGLLLALAAGVGAADGWCAAVGLPELGLLAASGYGIDPRRLLLVDAPGAHWPEVVSALAGAVEVVLLRPSGPVAARSAARLGAVLRRSGCVLLVAGEWPGAGLRLGVRSSRWVGLGAGHGLLAGRQAEVVVQGRGAAARGRTARLWLPDGHGVVRALTEEEAARETAPEAERERAGLGGEPRDIVGRGGLTAV